MNEGHNKQCSPSRNRERKVNSCISPSPSSKCPFARLSMGKSLSHSPFGSSLDRRTYVRVGILLVRREGSRDGEELT